MNDTGPRTIDIIEGWETRLVTSSVLQAECNGRIKARGSVQEIQQAGLYWTITSGIPTEVFRETTVMWEIWGVDRPGKSAVRSALEMVAEVDRLMTRVSGIVLPLANDKYIALLSVLEGSYDSMAGELNWARHIMRYRYTHARVRARST